MKVKNPTKAFTPGVTKKYIDVPDSSSLAYKLQLSRDWNIRIWAEMQRYRNDEYLRDDGCLFRGQVVFITLTYNDNCLPVYPAVVDGREYKLPAFNAADYKEYMRSMRQYIRNYYGLVGSGHEMKALYTSTGIRLQQMSLPIRVIWCCEYGQDERFTQRAHYHACLFFPAQMMSLREFDSGKLKDGRYTKISEGKLRNFCEFFWNGQKKPLHVLEFLKMNIERQKLGLHPLRFKYDIPNRGFVVWSKKYGALVSSEFAGEYTSKYCFKDLKYYANPDVRSYLYPDGVTLDKDRLKKMKGYLPGHWQSQSFGSALVELYDSLEALTEGIDFSFTGAVLRGKRYKSPCPTYIRRKICYDRTDDCRFVLNEKGIKYNIDSFADKVSFNARRLKSFLSAKGIDSNIDKDVIKEFFFKKYGVKNAQMLADYITEILCNRIYDELVIYERVWKGIVYSREHGEYLSNLIDSLSYSEYFKLSQEQYYLNLSAPSNPEYFYSDGAFRGATPAMTDYYPILPDRWRGFDTIIEIRDKITEYSLNNKNNAYLQRREDIKNTKHCKIG